MKIRSLIAASLLLAATGLAQASLVTNGGFESGMTGWTCDASFGGCAAGTQGAAAVDGTAYFWGAQNIAPPGLLSQTLATEAGASYSVSLIFNTNGGAPPNTLVLSVGDLSETLALVPGTWSSYSGVFTASGASTALDFVFTTEIGSGTVWIDSVVVDRIGTVPVPTSLALAALGLAGLVASRRARKT